MTETWAIAALWLGLALLAVLISIWFRTATALSEIVVGTLAQWVVGVRSVPLYFQPIHPGSRFWPVPGQSC